MIVGNIFNYSNLNLPQNIHRCNLGYAHSEAGSRVKIKCCKQTIINNNLIILCDLRFFPKSVLEYTLLAQENCEEDASNIC